MVAYCRTGMAESRAALRIRDPHKEEKMVAIHKALRNAVRKTPCFTKMKLIFTSIQNWCRLAAAWAEKARCHAG